VTWLIWTGLIWTGLIVGGLTVVAALAFLGVRLLQAWRTFKRFRRRLGKELDGLATAVERMSQAAERTTHAVRLDRSLGRLRVTLARFAILREALDEATGVVGRFTAQYPRK
jgi:hypothetical protein